MKGGYLSRANPLNPGKDACGRYSRLLQGIVEKFSET
jgi:hypothetical protein